MKHKTTSTAGAYLGGGGIGPWPSPLVARIVQLAQNSMQNCGMPLPPPLCNLGRKSERTSGQNLGEDLFFGLNLILGRKTN